MAILTSAAAVPPPCSTPARDLEGSSSLDGRVFSTADTLRMREHADSSALNAGACGAVRRRGKPGQTKTLLAIVTRGGPTFLNVVRHLAASNRRLSLSLLIYKTSRFDCRLPHPLRDAFGDIVTADHDAVFHEITA